MKSGMRALEIYSAAILRSARRADGDELKFSRVCRQKPTWILTPLGWV